MVGRKAWLDEHKIRGALASYHRSRMPAELGWFGLDAESVDRPATSLDEAELLGVRSVALDVPFSVETTVASLRANPHSEAILRLLARYERLRLDRTVPAAMRARLATGEWRLLDERNRDGESVFVRREEQPPVVGQRKYAAPGARQNVLLLGGDGGAQLVLDVPRGDATRSGTLIARRPVAAADAGLLARVSASVRAWRGQGASPEVDLSRHRALAVTLSIEIGPREDIGAPPVLDVQLEAVGERYRDHLIDLDFSGERTIVLELPSAERVVRELPPAAETYPLKAALSGFDRSRVVALDLRWMRGARSPGMRVRIARIEALSDR